MVSKNDQDCYVVSNLLVGIAIYNFDFIHFAQIYYPLKIIYTFLVN